MSGVKNPYRPSDTVLLRKIPRDLNSITKLSSHFEKFGTIVNLQVSSHYMYIVTMAIIAMVIHFV